MKYIDYQKQRSINMPKNTPQGFLKVLPLLIIFIVVFGALYLFRDNRGREVDIIHDSVTSIDILEIKSSSIFRTSFLKGLNYIKTLPVDINSAYLVCGGDESYERDGVNIRTWRNVPML